MLDKIGISMFAAVHFHHCFLANILQAETTIPQGYKCEIKNIGHGANYFFTGYIVYVHVFVMNARENQHFSQIKSN